METMKTRWNKGVREIYPTNKLVENWLFTETSEDEAELVNAMAVIAEKEGLNANHLQYLFPAVLKMLNRKSDWTK